MGCDCAQRFTAPVRAYATTFGPDTASSWPYLEAPAGHPLVFVAIGPQSEVDAVTLVHGSIPGGEVTISRERPWMGSLEGRVYCRPWRGRGTSALNLAASLQSQIVDVLGFTFLPPFWNPARAPRVYYAASTVSTNNEAVIRTLQTQGAAKVGFFIEESVGTNAIKFRISGIRFDLQSNTVRTFPIYPGPLATNYKVVSAGLLDTVFVTDPFDAMELRALANVSGSQGTIRESALVLD